MEPSKKQLEDLSIELARKSSKAFDQWCNKTFEFPAEYHPLSALRQSFASGLLYPNLIEVMPEYADEGLAGYISSNVAANFDFPFYLVSKSILSALQQTTPPRYWDKTEVKMGFPCITFVLPKDSLYGDNGEQISSISILMMSGDEQKMLLAFMVASQMDQLIINSMSKSKDDSTVFCVANSAESQTIWYAKHKVEGDMIDLDVKLETYKSKLRSDDDPEKVGEFTDRLFPLLLQLLMMFHLRPESVEEPTLIRKIKGKHTTREFWTPRFLGRKYQAISEVRGDGTHASPKTHWRIGHYRQQHYGPQNSKVKTLWIEPCMINAPS